ncbi:MAG: hypothetical protein NTY32_01415, partial [Bacteroidia bacterium]|nr:hypothetical protein [Bacteroidia bacterium]
MTQKSIHYIMVKSIHTDELTQLSQTVDIEYDAYGNPVKKITTTGDRITTDDAWYSASGALYPCKLDSSVTTTQLGSDTYVRQASIEYDDVGRITKKTIDPGKTNQLSIEYKLFNSYGLPTRIETSANGKTLVETCTYTSSDRFLASQTDALGETTSYTWDETTGRLASSTNRIGTTTNHYDGLGRLWKTDHPDGTSSSDVLQWASQNNFSAKFYQYQAGTGSAPVYSWYDQMGRNVVTESYLLGGDKSR